MSGDESNLSKKDRAQVVDWHVKGFNAKEISLKFAREEGKTFTTSTIQDYLAREEVQEEIQVQNSIREKEAEYDKKELVRDLKKMKDEMWSYLKELQDNNQGMNANEAANNMLKATKQLGDYLDAFDNQGSSANVVKINELNVTNITNIVKKMPKEKKEDIVSQLEEDPDIENFAIQRKN